MTKRISFSIVISYFISFTLSMLFLKGEDGYSFEIVKMATNLPYLLLIMMIPVIMEIIIFMIISKIFRKEYITVIIFVFLSFVFSYVSFSDLKISILKSILFILSYFLLSNKRGSIGKGNVIDSGI